MYDLGYTVSEAKRCVPIGTHTFSLELARCLVIEVVAIDDDNGPDIMLAFRPGVIDYPRIPQKPKIKNQTRKQKEDCR